MEMGEAILRAPMPKNMSPEQQQEYRKEISNIADPLIAQGQQLLRAAVDRSSELDTHTIHTTQARDSLARSDKSFSPNYGEVGWEVRQSAWVGQ